MRGPSEKRVGMFVRRLMRPFLHQQANFTVFGLSDVGQDVVAGKRFAVVSHAAQVIMRVAAAFVIKQSKRLGTQRRATCIVYKYRLVRLGFLELLQ